MESRTAITKRSIVIVKNIEDKFDEMLRLLTCFCLSILKCEAFQTINLRSLEINHKAFSNGIQPLDYIAAFYPSVQESSTSLRRSGNDNENEKVNVSTHFIFKRKKFYQTNAWLFIDSEGKSCEKKYFRYEKSSIFCEHTCYPSCCNHYLQLLSYQYLFNREFIEQMLNLF